MTECKFLPLARFWNWKTRPSFWTVNREESYHRKSPLNSQSGKRASFPVSRQRPRTLCVTVLLPPDDRHRCGVSCYLNKLSASSAESRASEQGRHHRGSVRRNGHLGNSPAHPWHPRGRGAARAGPEWDAAAEAAGRSDWVFTGRIKFCNTVSLALNRPHSTQQMEHLSHVVLFTSCGSDVFRGNVLSVFLSKFFERESAAQPSVNTVNSWECNYLWDKVLNYTTLGNLFRDVIFAP